MRLTEKHVDLLCLFNFKRLEWLQTNHNLCSSRQTRKGSQTNLKENGYEATACVERTLERVKRA